MEASNCSNSRIEVTTSVANDTTSTVTMLRKSGYHVAGVIGCYAETRSMFLKERFKGKAPHTAITLNELQRYDHGDLSRTLVSYDYSLNKKALILVYKFGDTFKGLCDFVYYMLAEKEKFSMELQESIVKLHNFLFGMVVLLENFRGFLRGKREFQTIFSKSKVAQIDDLIAKFLPLSTPKVVDNMRNWYTFEQVYVACADMAAFIDLLLLPFMASHL